jgi:hypothetical protein
VQRLSWKKVVGFRVVQAQPARGAFGASEVNNDAITPVGDMHAESNVSPDRPNKALQQNRVIVFHH